jgi:hypothetical protein
MDAHVNRALMPQTPGGYAGCFCSQAPSNASFAVQTHRYLRLPCRCALALVIACAPPLLGCGEEGVSPQPEPQCLPLPDFDLDRMQFESGTSGTTLIGDPMAIYAICGSEKLGDGVLRATHLDSAAPEIEAAIAADGSFAMPLPGSATDVYRLEIVMPGDDWRYRNLVDVTSEAGRVIKVAPCLSGGPYVLDSSGVGASTLTDVSLQSECRSEVSLTEASMRVGEMGFAVATDPVGTTVTPGSTAALQVRFEPATDGIHTDILLVRFAGRTDGRTAITLRAEATPE